MLNVECLLCIKLAVLRVLALVLWHYLLHLLHYRHVIVGEGELIEVFLVLACQLVWILTNLATIIFG